MPKIGRWIALGALLFGLYKGVDCHLDNLKKQRIENTIKQATEYIKEDFKGFYGRETSNERARLYAETIYKYAEKYDIPYDWALAVVSHESHFKNSTFDLNLPVKARGIACFNDSTKAYYDRERKARGEEVTNVIGEEYLNFIEAQIRDYLQFIHDHQEKNNWTIETTLAKKYNPGMGWGYVEKVNEKRIEIEKFLNERKK